MAHFVLSPNSEESLKSTDPDHLKGGLNHVYNTSCVKNQVNSFCVTYPDRHTNRLKFITLALLSGSEGKKEYREEHEERNNKSEAIWMKA